MLYHCSSGKQQKKTQKKFFVIQNSRIIAPTNQLLTLKKGVQNGEKEKI